MITTNNNGQRELRQYLRDKNNNPRGVLVASGPGQVGWAVAHRKDAFNKEFGLKIARGRAGVNQRNHHLRLPEEFQQQFDRMLHRSYKAL